MAGNTGSAESAGGGKPDTGHEANGPLGREVRAAGPATPRLYIVSNSDDLQEPTAVEKPVTSAVPRKSKGMLDRTVQGQIGRMLRDVFEDVAEEAVPERFVMLLEALEAKEKQR